MWRRRPVFTFFTLVFALCALSLAVWWEASYHIEWDGDAVRPYIPCGDDWRITCFNGKLSLYRGDVPYNGGILSAQGGSERVDYSLAWNAPGFYIRSIQVTGPRGAIWIFTASIWPGYALILLLILPSRWLWLWRRTIQPINECVQYGYDLRGSAGACPEYGTKPGTSNGTSI